MVIGVSLWHSNSLFGIELRLELLAVFLSLTDFLANILIIYQGSLLFQVLCSIASLACRLPDIDWLANITCMGLHSHLNPCLS